MVRSKRPGRTRAGSRSAARLVAPITRMLAGVGGFFWICRPAGIQPFTMSRRAAPRRTVMGRLVEGLKLDEKFVDDAGDAFGLARPHTAPGTADGVDLLDETDGAAFATGVLAQGLEVGPDLAVGLAVVHRLEGRRGDEEERHARFGGHGLGHVGLARPRRPFEEQRPPGRTTHVLGELAVAEEEVEGLHDLVDDQPGAADVFEADVDLTGPIEDVRRPTGTEQGHDDGHRQQGDEGHGREVGHQGVGEMGHGKGAAPPEDGTGHEQQGDGEQDEAEPQQPPLTDPLTGVVPRRPSTHPSHGIVRGSGAPPRLLSTLRWIGRQYGSRPARLVIWFVPSTALVIRAGKPAVATDLRRRLIRRARVSGDHARFVRGAHCAGSMSSCPQPLIKCPPIRHRADAPGGRSSGTSGAVPFCGSLGTSPGPCRRPPSAVWTAEDVGGQAGACTSSWTG